MENRKFHPVQRPLEGFIEEGFSLDSGGSLRVYPTKEVSVVFYEYPDLPSMEESGWVLREGLVAV